MAKKSDRILELLEMPADQLKRFPLNPSIHSDQQAAAVESMLKKFGNVDHLKAFRPTAADCRKLNAAAEDRGISDRYSVGDVVLLDGHLRQQIINRGTVRVAILRMNFSEAAEFVSLFDFSGRLKDYDPALIADLLAGVNPDAAADAYLDLIRLQAESVGLFADFEIPQLDAAAADVQPDESGSVDDENGPELAPTPSVSFQFGEFECEMTAESLELFRAKVQSIHADLADGPDDPVSLCVILRAMFE